PAVGGVAAVGAGSSASGEALGDEEDRAAGPGVGAAARGVGAVGGDHARQGEQLGLEAHGAAAGGVVAAGAEVGGLGDGAIGCPAVTAAEPAVRSAVEGVAEPGASRRP